MKIAIVVLAIVCVLCFFGIVQFSHLSMIGGMIVKACIALVNLAHLAFDKVVIFVQSVDVSVSRS